MKKLSNAFDALLDDLLPVVPYVGRWLLNFCVDIAVVLVHPLSLILCGQRKHDLSIIAIRCLVTLVRYPAQLVLTIGSLILNAIASLLNNVWLQSHERALTQDEVRYLQPIFGKSVDYEAVRLQFGGVKEMLLISPQAVGNDIFIRETWGDRAMYSDWTLSSAGLRLLGHEVGHVWQYQHSGAGYIGDSLMTQVFTAIGKRSGLRLSDGYNLHIALKEKLAIGEWNVEQQAVMAELIGVASSVDKNGALTLESFNRVSGFKLSSEEFALATQAQQWFKKAG